MKKKFDVKKKIVYFIQLPPPIHGVSIINKIVFDSEIINKDVDKFLINLGYSKNIDQINKWSFYKIYKYFINLCIFLKVLLLKKPDFLYYSLPPTGIAFYKEIPFVIITKILGILPVYHLHGKGIEKNIQRKPFLLYLYRFVFNDSVVIHLSKKLMLNEISKLGLSNTKRFIIENGVENVDLPLIRNYTTLNLLFLSNILISKGFYILLQAFNLLSLKYPQLLLNVIGDFKNDIEKQHFYNYIYKNGLENKINFLGRKVSLDKYKLLIQNDIFIHPTLNDAFPLVILEAMQCGLPVISTIEGAIPEIIDDGINGFVVPKNDIDSLVEKIELLIKNQDLRIKMGKEARDKFLHNYTLEIFEQKIKKTFNDILTLKSNLS